MQISLGLASSDRPPPSRLRSFAPAQSVLLKYKGLYAFLIEHAPEVASEVKEAYTTTMRCAARCRARSREEPRGAAPRGGEGAWNADAPHATQPLGNPLPRLTHA